ncbi:hypothetical protein F5Y12DRAFT_749994 [Xylaria sp. FL1777]|nr:hypothetical protein F5Y12DRAFT_749994 [Xylaria sp. FL1777]
MTFVSPSGLLLPSLLILFNQCGLMHFFRLLTGVRRGRGRLRRHDATKHLVLMLMFIPTWEPHCGQAIPEFSLYSLFLRFLFVSSSFSFIFSFFFLDSSACFQSLMIPFLILLGT